MKVLLKSHSLPILSKDTLYRNMEYPHLVHCQVAVEHHHNTYRSNHMAIRALTMDNRNNRSNHTTHQPSSSSSSNSKHSAVVFLLVLKALYQEEMRLILINATSNRKVELVLLCSILNGEQDHLQQEGLDGFNNRGKEHSNRNISNSTSILITEMEGQHHRPCSSKILLLNKTRKRRVKMD